MIKKSKYGIQVTIWIYLLTLIKNINFGNCQNNENISILNCGLGGIFIILIVVIVIVALIFVMKRESDQMNKN